MKVRYTWSQGETEFDQIDGKVVNLFLVQLRVVFDFRGRTTHYYSTSALFELRFNLETAPIITTDVSRQSMVTFYKCKSSTNDLPRILITRT